MRLKGRARRRAERDMVFVSVIVRDECYCTRRYFYVLDFQFALEARRLETRELDDLTTKIDY